MTIDYVYSVFLVEPHFQAVRIRANALSAGIWWVSGSTVLSVWCSGILSIEDAIRVLLKLRGSG